MLFSRPNLRTLVLGAVLLLAGATACPAATWQFTVQLSETVASEPFSGRVYIFFARRAAEPRRSMRFLNSEPFIARDVTDWRPGESITFSGETPDMLAFPDPLSKLDLAGYNVQAVARLNPYDQNVGPGEGNGFSLAARLPDQALAEPVALVIDQTVPAYPFDESKWCKLLRAKSDLLSRFLGRDVFVSGAIVLPVSYYKEPSRTFPVILDIPGFYGSHHRGMTDHPAIDRNDRGVEFIRVYLDSACPLGHHAFADSENNGPYATALLQEFLPALANQFRVIDEPTARFLTGHSSGGWSSLWLQVNHPDQFGGTWSFSPDPVDFRDFQNINLYADNQNLFHDSEGNPRPLAQSPDRVLIWFEEMSRIEHVLGHGGQLHSFEAVFSPRNECGKPRRLWDRATGAVSEEVAHSWKRYDIRRLLEDNWKQLEPKLQGKLHVHSDRDEAFFLDGAVQLLKESLERLGSDAEVTLHPGFGHGTYLTEQFLTDVEQQMAVAFLRHHALVGSQ